MLWRKSDRILFIVQEEKIDTKNESGIVQIAIIVLVPFSRRLMFNSTTETQNLSRLLTSGQKELVSMADKEGRD